MKKLLFMAVFIISVLSFTTETQAIESSFKTVNDEKVFIYTQLIEKRYDSELDLYEKTNSDDLFWYKPVTAFSMEYKGEKRILLTDNQGTIYSFNNESLEVGKNYIVKTSKKLKKEVVYSIQETTLKFSFDFIEIDTDKEIAIEDLKKQDVRCVSDDDIQL